MPSESEIITRIRKMAGTTPRVIAGIGDDAAVVRTASDRELIVCSDLSVEGVHFRRDWSRPGLIGRKALAVTLSDVAAMGGVPRFALISIAIPAELSTSFVDELIEGLFEMASEAGVAVIGGDTSSSPEGLVADTIVIGECLPGHAVLRSGARVGDRIFVTGSLGASAFGLALLEFGERLTPDTDDRIRRALAKQLNPEPRLEAGRILAESGLATSMIDISDGLSTDLSHILDESRCGAVIEAAKVPIAVSDEEMRFIGGSATGLDLALHGGEEYELLFTAPNGRANDIEALATKAEIRIAEIGQVTKDSGIRLEREGSLEPLRPGGYEHLS